MIESELTQTEPTSKQGTAAVTILIAGSPGAELLANELRDKGLACHFMNFSLESDANSCGFTYQQLSPVLAQAQEQALQLVITAQPEEHKLSIGVRKSADAPFQLLSVHQLAAVLADALSDQAAEKDLVCIRSVVMTDMLDSILLRKEYACKAEVLNTENLPEIGAGVLAETGASEVLAVTEKGEFWSNRGLAYLVEQLIRLHEAQAEQDLSLFDKLLELYYRYGFYKEKVLAVTLSSSQQEDHYLRLMKYFRTTKSASVASMSIKEIIDYKQNKLTSFISSKQLKLTSRPADMLKVVFTDGMSLMFVPAPEKMYLYLSLSGKLMSKQEYLNTSRTFDQRLMKLLELVNKL